MSGSQAGSSGNSLNPSMRVVPLTGPITLNDSYFTGNVLLTLEAASATDLTVPTGIKLLEPVNVINKGTGFYSFVAAVGVTIHSKSNALRLDDQYSMATLIPDPDNVDTYWLVGDLAV